MKLKTFSIKLKTLTMKLKTLIEEKTLFILLTLLTISVPSYIIAQDKQDALVLYNNGLYKEAIEICEKEIQVNPSRVDSYVVMCWALVRNKQYNEAEARALEGLKISMYDLRLTEVLGEARYYLGKNALAMEQFQKYVSQASESASRIGVSYYYMGEIYVRQGRYKHADISFTMAVKKEPSLDRWWTRLGYSREMAKEYESALLAYEEALKLNSSSVDAKKGQERVLSKI